MKANPDKYQAIAIGKNAQSKNISFYLNGNIIKTEDKVKFLGVTIDYELRSWGRQSKALDRSCMHEHSCLTFMLI
jgi:hypothetical protein